MRVRHLKDQTQYRLSADSDDLETWTRRLLLNTAVASEKALDWNDTLYLVFYHRSPPCFLEKAAQIAVVADVLGEPADHDQYYCCLAASW